MTMPLATWSLSPQSDLIGDSCGNVERSLAGRRDEEGPPDPVRIWIGKESSMYCTSTSWSRPESELAVPLSSSGTLSFVGGVSLCKAETRS